MRCDPEIDQDAVDQYQSFHYGMGDYQENPIVIEADSEGGKARKVAKGEYSGSGGRRGPFDMNTSEYTENVSVGEEEYSMMTDFSLGSSSDSDYQLTGRPYVPYTIRRMTQLGVMSGPTREESEAQRLEREASQKEEADAAAAASGNQFPPPPPPLMTQQQFLQYMQMTEERQRVTLEQQNKFFQELLQQNRVERPENHGVTLLDFQNTKPISFAYAPEPMDVEDWLMDTERKLKTVGSTDEEKVRYAAHLLCGPAASWWDNIVAVHPVGRIFTWEEFKQKFRESNVPESVMELKRREFENVEQKDKSILTYVREFSQGYPDTQPMK
ncbi:hypothetical protein QYE76_041687 [Lolium multiflorum]|uniref:Retrotransposon gag domain-containing protein n=1 Tax=Lolium multiflorum TaxID=4521 RepID=A0AAD8WUD7_LOLMU|nr:hypothetical protein QYE76_041687 [Lolium multiflorum]